MKNNLNPTWKKFTIPLQTLCYSDLERPLKVPPIRIHLSSWQPIKCVTVPLNPVLPLQVDCSDYDSDGSHDLIGSFTTKVSDMQKTAHGSPVSPPMIRHVAYFSLLLRGYWAVPCCSLGAIWLHPSRETEEEEELQELWSCLCQELQGKDYMTHGSLQGVYFKFSTLKEFPFK